ncbi:MAG TPA: 3,4-dihydroxy-2-butanone-4-phosphate synthase [Actinomycetota bacterium]|nr:3,4-dihydroxy-2-butanone-4-phosphate synthase [Actinomycetota bacterium]
MSFVGIDEAAARVARGEMVLIVDAEDRENEGDVMVAAAHVTAGHINFMATHARGLVCMPCDGRLLDELNIAPMVPAMPMDQAAFTVSIDHVSVTTGISAPERALTIRRVLDPGARPQDFRRPGHVFPLRARPGGVLERPGHTEASVDLARLAGLPPAAAICEVLDEDGEVARLPRLREFAARHGLAMVAVDELMAHRASRGGPTALAAR